ncbi:hypothetical protein [Pelagicoccus sp. SDUM812002]|uniref:hypothetical protein n=1 Tax=Pelagicoccus sp. SDUM812002 TaxID=3041266 RepID=UPI00280DDD0E|nr:hypothetical protein [Pelagicoccus sp. SDUM812002]MDQ8184336.1 hypothetical protein [Pelagicoccus sp. SDUM812002]
MLPSRSMRVLCTCVVTSFAITSQSSAFTTDPSSVDLSIALKFSDYEVSQYIVDKNFNLEFGKHPNANDKKSVSDWFIQFFSHQALIAELRSKGWDQKREVVQGVVAMEKYMLLQDDSPVFQKLVEPSESNPRNLIELRKDASTRVTGSFLKLPSANAREYDSQHLKDLIIGSVPLERSVLGTTGAHAANTVLSWPYHPFMEFRNQISAAEIGQFYGPIRSRDSVLYFEVLDKDADSPVFADQSDQELAEYARFIERSVAIQAFSRKMIAESELETFPKSKRLFLDSIEYLGNGICQVANSSIQDYTLFSYRSNKAYISVSIEQFVDSLNSAILRQPITTESDLNYQIEQHTLSNLLYGITLSPGFHYNSKFEQDRLNFENNSILEHYKNQQRRKRPPPSDETLKNAFTTRFGGKIKVLEIVGNLEVHKSPDSILRGELPNRIDENIHINIEDGSHYYGMPTQLLASLREEECSLPIALNAEFAVFRKKGVSKSRPFTMSETRSQLEQTLFENKFKSEAIEALPDRIVRLQMQSRIDFSKYGISPPRQIQPKTLQ